MAKRRSLDALTRTGGLLDPGVGPLSSCAPSRDYRGGTHVGTLSRACIARHAFGATLSLERGTIGGGVDKLTAWFIAAGRIAWVLNMGEFQVLPRLRVRGGRAVHPDGLLDPRPDTIAVINRLLADHGRVLLWDLDGIERDQPRLDLFRPFEGDAVWLDAGIRTADSVIDVLVAGVEKAVIGTRTLRGLADLEEARDLSEDIVVQVDLDAPPPQRLRKWSVRRYLEWSLRAGLQAFLVVSETAVPVVEPADGSLAVYVGLARAGDFAAMRSAGCGGAIVDAWEAAAWKT